MKSLSCVFSIGLLTGLLSCKETPPERTIPASPTTPVESLTTIITSLPSTPDLFIDLPLSFPESERYRVTAIQVSTASDNKPVSKVWFSYDPTTGRLSHKEFIDYRGNNRAWGYDYLFDSQNRLTREKSSATEQLAPVDITYEYEGNRLMKSIQKTSAAYRNNLTLNLVTAYRYEGNRQVGATILNYYNAVAVSNVPYPMDSTRRQFVYGVNNQEIIVRDSVWRIPCYPNIPCINAFWRTDTTQRQFDQFGNLLKVNTSKEGGPYPNRTATFKYEYQGPGGLLSRISNPDLGVVYDFLFQEK